MAGVTVVAGGGRLAGDHVVAGVSVHQALSMMSVMVHRARFL